MYRLLALIAAYLAVIANGLNRPSPHIIGGVNAELGKYPYQVSLRINNKHFCGGSIVNENTILTAAHCIVGFLNAYYVNSVSVHAATVLLNETGIVYDVKKGIAHEYYNPFTIANDIGLLVLSSNITYSNMIQPIKLSKNDFAYPGYNCVLSGWGKNTYPGTVSNRLQEIKLKVYSQEECRLKHWRVRSTNICTYTKTGEGACHGDSGGPLVADGFQIGVVSFGEPCAKGYPDVFTKVSAFQQWLARHNVY